MSTAVPNVATVLKKRSSRSPARKTSGTKTSPPAPWWASASARPGVAADLLVEGGQRGVAGHRDLVAQALEQVRAPLAEVDDPRRHAVGMQATRMTLTGGASSSGATPSVSRAMPRVGRDHLPPAVDDRGRVGLVAAQHELERLAHRGHVGVVERRARRRAARSRRRAAARCGRAAGPRAARRAARTISALGRERPLSTKLTWRAETPASRARSIWLRRRRRRQSRSSGPTPVRTPTSVIVATIAAPPGPAPTSQVIDAATRRLRPWPPSTDP